jgi:hypothetical protein
MSQEQFTPPSFNRSPSSDGTRFETDDEIYLRESQLASIEQARAHLAAALASENTESTMLPEEAIADSEEKQRLQKIPIVIGWGSGLVHSRAAFGEDKFDLTQDDELTQDMFGPAA